MSELVSIVYKPRKATPTEDGYTRVPRQQALLVADYGIEGDAKGGSPKRQLNVMSARVVEELTAEGFQAAPGQLGEQLIVEGVEVDALPLGTRLTIGEQACVEIIEPRTGCGKFERYQGRSPKEAAGRLGMMARVVIGGEIAVGDPVRVADSVG
jgi:MOSC domain-containing protein YiiM